MRLSNWGWTVIVLVLLPAKTPAAVLPVPGDHPSIQHAIDHAADGDTVLVAPGVYHENVRVRGKAVALLSHFVLDGEPDTIAQTVIDGSTAADPDSGSTVIFAGITTPGAELRGFTIRGGIGTRFPAEGTTLREGGGVLVRNASLGTVTVAIRDNVIRNNLVRRLGAAYSGGAGLSTWFTPVLVERNVFLENQGEQYAGAIICNRGPMTARNNLFVGNRQEDGTLFAGAALFFYFGWTSGPFENNTFADHVVMDGAASSLLEAYGGTAVVALRNNVFDETVPLFSTSAGGAVASSYSVIPTSDSGDGNLVGAPDFADSQFVLQPTSLGVDAGSLDGNDPEDPEHPGAALFPARGSIVRDMGVYGGPGMPPRGFPVLDTPAGVGGEVGEDLGNESGEAVPSLRLRIGGAHPLFERGWVEVETFQPGDLDVRLHDARGRRIRTLESGTREAGVYRIALAPGSLGLDAGLYFVHANSAGQSARIKLVVIR